MFGKIKFGETSCVNREDSGFLSSGWSSQVTLRSSKRESKVPSSTKTRKKTVTKVIPENTKKILNKKSNKVPLIDSDKNSLLSVSMPRQSSMVSKKKEVASIKDKSNALTEETNVDENESLKFTNKDSLKSDEHDDLSSKEKGASQVISEKMAIEVTAYELNFKDTNNQSDQPKVSSDIVLKATAVKTFENDSHKIASHKANFDSDTSVRDSYVENDKSNNNQPVIISNEPSVLLETNKSSLSDSGKQVCSDKKLVLSCEDSDENIIPAPIDGVQDKADMQSSKTDEASGDNKNSVSENGSEVVEGSEVVSDGEDAGIGALFKLIDSDGDGFITLDKLRRVSVQLGLNFTEEEMIDMIAEADPSNTGQVNYNKVNTLFQETKVAMDAEQKLLADIKDAFKLFDTGQCGMLHTFRLTKALRIANMYPTDKDVRTILRNLGYPIKISYKQFKKIAIDVSRTDNERLVAAFQYFDNDNTGFLTEEKLRQILLPAICNDFTKKDMNDLISDFSSDGKIDLEVFVAYLTGQEQYLSTAKRPNIHKTALKLPAISENVSSTSRKKQTHTNKR